MLILRTGNLQEEFHLLHDAAVRISADFLFSFSGYFPVVWHNQSIVLRCRVRASYPTTV